MRALPNHHCPLCGQPNQCAAASSGGFDTPCWCAEQKIDPLVLARLPEVDRNRACLCPQCASGKPPPATD